MWLEVESLSGDSGKQNIVSLETVAGFSGSLVSNGKDFIGIMTGHISIGSDYVTKDELKGAEEIGINFAKALNYESLHKRLYGLISLVNDWEGSEDGKGENFKHFDIIRIQD